MVLRRLSQCWRRPAWAVSGLPARPILVFRERLTGLDKLRPVFCLARMDIAITASPVTLLSGCPVLPRRFPRLRQWWWCRSYRKSRIFHLSRMRFCGRYVWRIPLVLFISFPVNLTILPLFFIPPERPVCPSVLFMASVAHCSSMPRSTYCTLTLLAMTGFSISPPAVG